MAILIPLADDGDRCSPALLKDSRVTLETPINTRTSSNETLGNSCGALRAQGQHFLHRTISRALYWEHSATYNICNILLDLHVLIGLLGQEAQQLKGVSGRFDC